jgi:cytochrome c oxidase cbb3-type subunit 2
MELFNDHRKLFGTALILFLALTVLVAILPALNNQRNNAVLPGYDRPSEAVVKGRKLFIANGCVACHTQQVRNVDMDRTWGSRPSMAADYAPIHRTDFWRNTATLMGTERTGPDLTNIGTRQPSVEWQLTHLYNPRILVPASIMPAYPWLFSVKNETTQYDVIVNVPEEAVGQGEKVVANEEALQLVAYLLSLKQTTVPDGKPTPDFLYQKAAKAGQADNTVSVNGAELYAANCQACHQSNGEGLKGAFPSLKGSKVVLDENPELIVNIIMNGYTGRMSEGYGAMPAVGTNNKLSAEEVTAIINHEKTSWGNSAQKISPADVQKIMNNLATLTNKPKP